MVPHQRMPRREAPSGVVFEYTGKTGLTVIGPVSGTKYRFDRPGALVIVDARDRPGVAAVPNLKQIRSI
ncbi:hypothetical protein [Sorangium sp. So ce1153]|uniref:hypothetical protein n=1 Tax=Sorangium sp. So ce1153 TaxID=3133333 RepID=UPI003F630E27